jgi:hypothetical protein
MVVAYNDIINAIARAEDVALYNARARAIELSNGCKPSKEDDDKAIEIESWIQLLTRAAANYDHETCLTDDIIWDIIQNVNEQNRDVDCDVSRTYSRNASSGGGSNVPSGCVERVLGLYVDNTNPSLPVIEIFVDPLTISGDGTQADPFSAIGGGGSQTLAQTLILGNTSGANDIVFDAIYGLEFDNTSRLREGTIDAGLGGNKGIAEICGVGFESKWEAGRRYIMGSSGNTIRQSLYNFNVAPTATDDFTLGYMTGSLWTLDDGTVYVCTDAGTVGGDAMWAIGGIPNLQQVTDVGNSTTNNILVDDFANNVVTIFAGGVTVKTGSGGEGNIRATTMTNTVDFEIPDKPAGTETFAMLSDIPTVTAGTNISVTGTSTAPIINSLSDRYSTSSISTNDIDNNNGKVFIVNADLAYIPLQEVLIVNSPSKHMHGTVVSYSGTTLTVDINSHTGTGTFSSWVINLDGTPVDAITGVGTANEIAYFTGGQVIASLPVATYPSLTELSRVKNVGSQVVGTTDTNTLTNKRITARSGTVASSATPTINTDNVDFFSITGQTVDITNMSTNLTGVPTEGQTLWIAITGTAARAIFWGTSFEASTIALPTTTVTTARLDVAFIYNTVTSKWRCVGTC